MSNVALVVTAWLAVAVHVVIGIVVWRRPGGAPGAPLVPLLNLAVALCVMGYWVREWYSYVANGTTWYVTDQLLPLYAIVVCTLSLLALRGHCAGTVPHWLVFGIDAVVLLGAALLFSTFRMHRLI
jgi:hypothetical protein